MSPEGVLAILKEAFPDEVTETVAEGLHPHAVVKAENWHEFALFLRDDERLGFDWLRCLSGVDHIEDKLLTAVDVRCPRTAAAKVNPQSYSLPTELKKKVTASLDDWLVNGKTRRLWNRDTTLWTRSDESKWLGWLGIIEDQLAHGEYLRELASEVKADSRKILRFVMGDTKA